MKAALGDRQLAGFIRLNTLRANRVASLFFSHFGRDGRASASEGTGVGKGEGESEGHPQAPKTPHLSPLPLPKGRGEKGQRVSLSFSNQTIGKRYYS